jgi:hypothetical protein
MFMKNTKTTGNFHKKMRKIYFFIEHTRNYMFFFDFSSLFKTDLLAASDIAQSEEISTNSIGDAVDFLASGGRKTTTAWQ